MKAVSLFVFVLALGIPAAQAQPDFRVESSLVVLHVSVTDHKGDAVRDLPKDSFHVSEDGVPQAVTLFSQEDLPVAAGLVVDNSGSMRRKLPEVVAAAFAFARSSNPDDQMFVVHFNERVVLGLPPGKAFITGPDQLEAAMLRIRAIGQTALYDAIADSLGHISRSPLHKKVLIVLSDGGDNASHLRFEDVLTAVQQSNVVVYTVGIFDEYDADRNPKVLKKLAKVSGGTAFFPHQVSEVTQVLQLVSRDIRNQYTVGYVPTNVKRDGTYRSVSVKLTGAHSGKWNIRARTGYFALPPTG